MADSIRVIVTGSRALQEFQPVWDELYRCLGRFPDSNIVVVHGACPTGADAAAAEWARSVRLPRVTEERHPADWGPLGGAAGPIRNRKMAELGATVCLAFPLKGPVHKSRGTWSMIHLAVEHGIPTMIFPT